MSKKLYDVVARVMKVQAEKINDDSGPENMESWDSFNGLVLLDELEKEFQVKFTLDEAEDVFKVADIKRHLKNHNVDLDG